MGGAALHLGWVAEMKTGEGKTLVATLPSYLNALAGRGVHLITVNDYLASSRRRLDGPAAPLPRPHGRQDRPRRLRRPRRSARSTTATSRTAPTTSSASTTSATTWSRASKTRCSAGGATSRLLAALLRDRRRGRLDPHRRGAHAAHHLGPRDRRRRALLPVRAHRARAAARARLRGRRGQAHRRADRRGHRARRGGARRREPLRARQPELRAPDPAGVAAPRSCSSATSTTSCSNGEVHIVDEFTGRILEGRRWSEGLHQAVEAKEGVHIKEENQTLATVTLQNYFRMYNKLSGMTGTANTEAGEFAHTYDLQVVSIPTNRPMVRIDNADFIYKTEDAKYNAAIDDIAERHEKGQPVLVGTISVEKSEKLSRLLEKRGIPHEVLNAKQHDREAEIITQAGPALGGHRRHQHGRPRRRHPARRQPRGPGPPRVHARRARRSARPSTRPATPSCCPRFKDECKVEGDKVRGRRRPLRARHRAPRVAPHRQPAARPVRPPGRPGREPLLPVARRRADAPVRHRAHAARDGQVVRGRRAARVEDGLEGGRARAGHGRGPQLRDPQGRAQVRRGDERAAQDHLPAPPADPRRRRPPRRRGRRDRVRRSAASSTSTAAASSSEEWNTEGLLEDTRTHFPTRVTKEQLDAAGDTQAMDGAAPRRRDRAVRREGSSRSARRRSATSSAA